MELMELLRTRRTYRRFDQSRAVADEAVRDMAEAVRLSSSAANLQPLQFVFVRDARAVEALFPHTHWAGYLPKEVGTPKDGEHPTMYAVVLYNEEKKSRWLDEDVGLATSNLTLAAWNRGVGSCIMANIDRQDIAQLLNVRPPMAIHTVIALGYPTHESAVVDIADDGSVKYYLDDSGNYRVPKRKIEDIIVREHFEE